MLHVQFLLGGVSQYGWDAYVPGINTGFLALRDRVAKLPNVKVQTDIWGNWPKVRVENPFAVVGYSGGGSRATWLANRYPRPTIELLVAYDPSPAWQMMAIRSNVKHAICYHNRAPYMFGLGGGTIAGDTKITTYTIAQQHLAVQYDQSLHEKTITAIKALTGG